MGVTGKDRLTLWPNRLGPDRPCWILLDFSGPSVAGPCRAWGVVACALPSVCVPSPTFRTAQQAVSRLQRPGLFAPHCCVIARRGVAGMPEWRAGDAGPPPFLTRGPGPACGPPRGLRGVTKCGATRRHAASIGRACTAVGGAAAGSSWQQRRVVRYPPRARPMARRRLPAWPDRDFARATNVVRAVRASRNLLLFSRHFYFHKKKKIIFIIGKS